MLDIRSWMLSATHRAHGWGNKYVVRGVRSSQLAFKFKEASATCMGR